MVGTAMVSFNNRTIQMNRDTKSPHPALSPVERGRVTNLKTTFIQVNRNETIFFQPPLHGGEGGVRGLVKRSLDVVQDSIQVCKQFVIPSAYHQNPPSLALSDSVHLR